MTDRPSKADVLIWFNWALVVLSLAGWPVSALTWARSEPQTVLGLSWAAITIGAFSSLLTAYVNRRVDHRAEG